MNKTITVNTTVNIIKKQNKYGSNTEKMSSMHYSQSINHPYTTDTSRQ